VELQPVLDRLEQSADKIHKKTQVVDAGLSDLRLNALIRAAGEFITVNPITADTARSEADSEADKSANSQAIHVIPQFPWSAPNTRAALAGFTGMFLSTGNHDAGRAFLRYLAGYLHEGLIPSEFPEAGGKPLYLAADVSLWFINAVWEYFECTGDLQTTGTLLSCVEAIISAYRRGTELGIVCDADGLIASRAPMLATSWMDARVGDWVVTPRGGRPVELNALWYNAVRIASELCRKFERRFAADEMEQVAARISESFNRHFWNANLKCCFDVVDDHGSDPTIRPNQIFSLSLPHPVLAKEYWQPMLKTVFAELLTPMGLRTLSPHDPAYQGKYAGNVVSRERAQHQGSVYVWLLGPLARAYIRAFGSNDDSIARIAGWIAGPIGYAEGNGLGQICELFDGNAPHAHGGAVASALAVCEILRCHSELVLGISTRRPAVSPIKIDLDSPPISVKDTVGNS
jgi:glycogen debranching enzyme